MDDSTREELGPSENDGADIAPVADGDEIYEAEIVDDAIAPPSGVDADPHAADDDYFVAEIVDDPPTPAIRIDAGASKADYDRETRERKFDRGEMRVGAHRYRQRVRRTSIVLASVGFFVVLGLFALIKIVAELPDREEYAGAWHDADELYEDDDWRRQFFSDGTKDETDAQRRRALREAYEELERIQRDLESNSVEELPRIENLEEAILADAEWPDSALSELPLASDDEPLRSNPFRVEQRLTEYLSTTQYVSGDGLRARRTRIVESAPDNAATNASGTVESSAE